MKASEKAKQARLEALARIAFDCASSGEVWLFQALELKKSADVLFRKGDRSQRTFTNPLRRRASRFASQIPNSFHVSGFLLLGLAIENLIKGILIELDESLVKTALDSSLRTHDIPSLLAKIPKRFRPSFHSEVAKGLRANVEWVSKYPIPKKPGAGPIGLVRSEIQPALALFAALLRSYLKVQSEKRTSG